MWNTAAAAAACLVVAACRAQPSEPQFPAAHRDVAPTVSDTFSTEDARDRVGEAEQVMELAGVKPGMSVADVGAGEGYYTESSGPGDACLPRTLCPRFATSSATASSASGLTMSQ